MKMMSNIGHLVRIEDAVTKHREFIFLYILDNDPPDAYKTVIKGIRGLKMPAGLKKKTIIQADAVADFSDAERDFPEIIGYRIHTLPVVSFYRIRKKAFKESLFLSGIKNIVEKQGTFFPTNRLTAVATGSDFFARDDILLKIWKQIKNSRNVVITGPRRYGKTSIMRCIKDEAGSSGYQPVMIDLEAVYSSQELMVRLEVETKYRDLTETKKNKQLEKLIDDQVARWKANAEKFFKQLAENKKQKHIFILDEVPYMLDSFLEKDVKDQKKPNDALITKVNDFLTWFKSQREAVAGRSLFIFSGSIHLKAYLRDNGLDRDSFSDCQEIRLDFFNPETTRDYIEGLLLGQEIVVPDEMIQKMVDLTTPGIPYFIQIVTLQVASLYRKNPKFSLDDLAASYQKEIVGPDSRRFFDTFERHFKRYGQRKPGAKAILDQLSNANDEGIKRIDLEKAFSAASYQARKADFDILLQYLEHDFYIEKIKGSDRYRFSSPLLRDYWLKNQKMIVMD